MLNRLGFPGRFVMRLCTILVEMHHADGGGSIDPVSADPNTGAMFNRYNYAFNNPYRYTDPDGRSPVRLLGMLGKGIYKLYRIYKKTGKIDGDSLKRLGIDEVAGIADDLKTIFSGNGSTLDIVLAAVDLVTGLDVNNKASRAARAADTTVARGARNPKVASAAARGRQMHRDHDYGPGFEREVTLPSGKRADAVNFGTREVVELKPNNPRAIRRGERQVEGYRRELESQTGDPRTSRVETYD